MIAEGYPRESSRGFCATGWGATAYDAKQTPTTAQYVRPAGTTIGGVPHSLGTTVNPVAALIFNKGYHQHAGSQPQGGHPAIAGGRSPGSSISSHLLPIGQQTYASISMPATPRKRSTAAAGAPPLKAIEATYSDVGSLPSPPVYQASPPAWCLRYPISWDPSNHVAVQNAVSSQPLPLLEVEKAKLVRSDAKVVPLPSSVIRSNPTVNYGDNTTHSASTSGVVGSPASLWKSQAPVGLIFRRETQNLAPAPFAVSAAYQSPFGSLNSARDPEPRRSATAYAASNSRQPSQHVRAAFLPPVARNVTVPASIVEPRQVALAIEAASPPPVRKVTKSSRGPSRKTTSQTLRSSTPAYAGLVRPKRGPRKRAVIVGVSYASCPEISLGGSCNDAAAFALTLVNVFGFQPEEVLLLIDAYPAPCYRPSNSEPLTKDYLELVAIPDESRLPNRRNILLALHWLTKETQAGDVNVFYFAGHGIQVDDMSGWENEGYDEAIMPMDFQNTATEEMNPLTAIMVKNLVLNVAEDVQTTILLDCNGGQTMLDPAGTGTWSFIKGVKQKGVWPLITDPTNKVQLAYYDENVWKDANMMKRRVKPRFLPGIEVASVQDLLDPVLQNPARLAESNVRGYLIAAAPWGQIAVEAVFDSIGIVPLRRDGFCQGMVTETGRKVVHGVFTYCLIGALQAIVKRAYDALSKTGNVLAARSVSYRRLVSETQNRVKALKKNKLTRLNQLPELTTYSTGPAKVTDFFLWPWGGKKRGVAFATCKDPGVPLIPPLEAYCDAWTAEEKLRRAADEQRAVERMLVESRDKALQQTNHRSFGSSTPHLGDSALFNLASAASASPKSAEEVSTSHTPTKAALHRTLPAVLNGATLKSLPSQGMETPRNRMKRYSSRGFRPVDVATLPTMPVIKPSVLTEGAFPNVHRQISAAVRPSVKKSLPYRHATAAPSTSTTPNPRISEELHARRRSKRSKRREKEPVKRRDSEKGKERSASRRSSPPSARKTSSAKRRHVSSRDEAPASQPTTLADGGYLTRKSTSPAQKRGQGSRSLLTGGVVQSLHQPMPQQQHQINLQVSSTDSLGEYESQSSMRTPAHAKRPVLSKLLSDKMEGGTPMSLTDASGRGSERVFDQAFSFEGRSPLSDGTPSSLVFRMNQNSRFYERKSVQGAAGLTAAFVNSQATRANPADLAGSSGDFSLQRFSQSQGSSYLSEKESPVYSSRSQQVSYRGNDLAFCRSTTGTTAAPTTTSGLGSENSASFGSSSAEKLMRLNYTSNGLVSKGLVRTVTIPHPGVGSQAMTNWTNGSRNGVASAIAYPLKRSEFSSVVRNPTSFFNALDKPMNFAVVATPGSLRSEGRSVAIRTFSGK